MVEKISKNKDNYNKINKNENNPKIFDYFPKTEKIEKKDEKTKKQATKPKKDCGLSVDPKASLLSFGFKKESSKENESSQNIKTEVS